MTLKLPTIDDCEFTLECLDEDTPVHGAFASGEDELDRELETNIINRLNQGDT